MNIKDWLHSATKEERDAVAKKAGTTVLYLKQLAGKHRFPSRPLAERLEEATKEITPDRVIDKVAATFGDRSVA